MAVKPQDNSAFLREVDEEVRKDQAADFWRKWGMWIAGAVILCLAALGGWLYWQNQQTAAAERQTEELSQILQDIAGGQPGDAEAQLATLATSSRPGIRAAALLTQADYALENGDTETAIAGFAAVAGDEGIPRQYRDLALVRQTAVEFEDMQPQAVIDRLATLARPGNPWFGSAAEMTAVALMAQDKNDEAGALFAQIAQGENVPDTLKTRAVQMAGVLGVDAVPDEPVDMDEGLPAPNSGAAQPAEANQ